MSPRVRWGAAALAFAGVMFVLYPAVRPWHDETTQAGAQESMASSAWVAAHFFAMLGFIAVPPALLALRTVVPGRLTAAALLTGWIGAGLTLPYYGAEDFGLHGAARSSVPDLVALSDEVRYGPVAATTFALGLTLLGVSAVLVAVAIWRSGAMPRAAGILFGAGFALFIPQFYLPPAARITHGILLAAGCWLLAWAMWRHRSYPQVGDRAGGRVHEMG